MKSGGPGEDPVLLLITQCDAVRRPVNEAARRAGYTCVEVAAAAVDVVVVDLGARDNQAEGAVERLRERFGAELPIIGLTGFFSAVPGLASTPTAISAYLPLPVDPAQLHAALAEHDAERRRGETTTSDPPRPEGRQPRVVLADDEPTQLRLSRIRLEQAGYDVILAQDGGEALRLARQHRPDAVVSDILMPGLTGFELCVEIRNTPTLARTPVILVSSAFVEPADRRLADECGATDFVIRTSTLTEVLAVLTRAVTQREPVVTVPDRSRVEAKHMLRLRRQLHVQVGLNRELARQSAFNDAELTVLNRIAAALADGRDIRATLNEVLQLCVERGALSIAVLYLYDQDGLPRVQAIAGHILDGAHEVPEPEQIERVMRRTLEGGQPVVLPGPDVGTHTSEGLLRKLGVSSALATGLRLYGRTLGLLVLGAERRELTGDVWTTYARTIGVHIAQALTLHRALTSHGDTPAGWAAERRERLLDDLRGLGAFSAAIRDAQTPGCVDVLDALTPLSSAPIGVFDARVGLAAFGETSGIAPILVDGNEPAFRFALDQLRSWYVGDGHVTRVWALEVDAGWAIHVTIAGGMTRPGLCGVVGREIIRRHGGDVLERGAGEGRALVIRLPRAVDPRPSDRVRTGSTHGS